MAVSAALATTPHSTPPMDSRISHGEISGSSVACVDLPADLTDLKEENRGSELGISDEPATPTTPGASRDFQHHDTPYHDVGLDPASPTPIDISSPKRPRAGRNSTGTVKDTETRSPSATTTQNTETTANTGLRITRGSTASLKRVMSGFSSVFHHNKRHSHSGKTLMANPTMPGTTHTNSQSTSSEDTATIPHVQSQDGIAGKPKNRSSTGFSLRGRQFGFPMHQSHARSPPKRRKSHDGRHKVPLESKRAGPTIPVDRDSLPLDAESGIGLKSHRLSLSLPDDFAVDVVDLTTEFEFEHKFLGRHGRLGKGAASKITTVHRKGFPQEIFVVKEFRSRSSRESAEDYKKKITSEFSIAKSLHHPNIVESIRLCTDHGRWNHVMEYCVAGDLYSLVDKKYLQDSSRTDDRACLFKQLIQGIAYLHRNGIAHRDIKLENLLMTKDSKLKITDFGVAEVFAGIHPGVREAAGECGVAMNGDIKMCAPGICGSLPYIAPEVLAKKDKYDPRGLDVWGAGIVMINLTFGGSIWHSATPGSQPYANFVKSWKTWYEKRGEDAVICGKVLDFPKYEHFEHAFHSPSLRRLMFRMLNPDPRKRIKAAEILDTRWHKNTLCCQPESYDEPTTGIDTTKIESLDLTKRTVIHNHRPPIHLSTHSLGKMPGQAGY